MLDTNIVSELIRDTYYDERILQHSTSRLTISSITEAEMQYGIARKPEAKRLSRAVHAFLQAVEICNFDSAAASSYGSLRSEYETKGIGLGNLDGLIAAHALSLGLTLVTRDAALLKLSPWVNIETWR